MLKTITRFFVILAFFYEIISLSGCASKTAYVLDSNGLGSSIYSVQTYSNAPSLWKVMAENFHLPDETSENPEVRKQINWYLSHKKYLYRVAEQSRPYLHYIYQQIKKRDLPAEFALLPIFESNYDPFAHSRVGAVGLWQMMPGAASGFGLKIDWWYDGRRDIIASTNAALSQLSYLGDVFNHDWLLVLAAYNAGEGRVSNAMQQNARYGRPTDFWSLALPAQTQSYVPKLLALATIIKHPFLYPADLPDIRDQPYLAAINIDSQIDLARAAQLADISLEELSHLNPGYTRFATDPNLPARLLLPIEKAAPFLDRLNQLPQSERITWVRYTIKDEDTLNSIARRFKTTEESLIEINKLKSRFVYEGQIILIPVASGDLTKLVLKSVQPYFHSKLSDVPETSQIEYEVQPGDTLESVARTHHTTAKLLKFWNGLKSTTAPLTPGQKLVIWPSKHHAYTIRAERQGAKFIVNPPSESFSAYSSPSETHPQNYRFFKTKNEKTLPERVSYRIKNGDTLFSISRKFGVPVKNIKSWNSITDQASLRPNQVLVIYK